MFRSVLAALACLLGGLAVSAAGPAQAADDLNSWSHSQNLYYDTSPAGADVPALIGNFPVLVRLRAANFPFDQAMRGGQDLRFSKPDGTPLNYEIERWDSAGAKADVWVRIDSIPGNSQGVLARMYWGKAGSVSASDGNAVFNPAIGFEYVWHLGGAGTGARPNSVGGKPAATPINYDGDESREGMAGLCDSLDGNAAGDYLDLGSGYTDLSPNLTISMWASPSRASVWGRLLDLGNGAAMDNILFSRVGGSQDLVFQLYAASGQTAAAELKATGALTLDQWQLFALTVNGTAASIYRNGVLVASGTLAAPVSNVSRIHNYLGHSNWTADEYFAGKLDEVELIRSSHSANWFKLAYANQKPDQTLISFTPPTPQCANPKFGVPADTSLAEASPLDLKGVADCASSYQWAAVSGPAPRILDPEVKTLHVALPRVTGDTTLVYRFTAMLAGAAQTHDVAVHVREAIPDPAFTLANAAWNGKDSLVLRPAIENSAAIRSSPESTLTYAWTLSGDLADTTWESDGLLLRAAPDGSVLRVGLCLGNNGPLVCDTATVTVGGTVGLAPFVGKKPPARSPLRDARGRRLAGESKSRRAFPVPRP
ncbi:MAG: DUF2341 domain-containing protein [Fibrobacteres bacterium]|nr:DUF2341 domain-containing protein [Fibrobacterota bacterium]